MDGWAQPSASAALVNGVNNAGELVGSYVTRGGTTDGLLAKPNGLRA